MKEKLPHYGHPYLCANGLIWTLEEECRQAPGHAVRYPAEVKCLFPRSVNCPYSLRILKEYSSP